MGKGMSKNGMTENAIVQVDFGSNQGVNSNHQANHRESRLFWKWGFRIYEFEYMHRLIDRLRFNNEVK